MVHPHLLGVLFRFILNKYVAFNITARSAPTSITMQIEYIAQESKVNDWTFY
jgi:hypothetical protein